MLDQVFIVNPWLAYGLSTLAILAAAEFGRRIGMFWRRRHPEAMSSDISMLVGAAFGLLALMIGFTYSMTLSRFDARQSIVVDEANAIGTTDLRARMLPEPHASEVRKLLRDYIDMRIALSQSPQTQSSLEEARRRSSDLQAQLWQHAAAVSAADPRSTPAGLFVWALNDMIDVQEKRLAAGRNRVPSVVFFLLYAVAIVAIGFSGYVGGLGDKIGRIPVSIMAAMIAGVIGIVSDIDRSQTGFITVDQQAMYNSRESMGQ